MDTRLPENPIPAADIVTNNPPTKPYEPVLVEKVPTPEIIAAAETEKCKIKFILRYNTSYETILLDLKRIVDDLGPQYAAAHSKTLDETEDCLGDMAIDLEVIKKSCR